MIRLNQEETRKSFFSCLRSPPMHRSWDTEFENVSFLVTDTRLWPCAHSRCSIHDDSLRCDTVLQSTRGYPRYGLQWECWCLVDWLYTWGDDPGQCYVSWHWSYPFSQFLSYHKFSVFRFSQSVRKLLGTCKLQCRWLQPHYSSKLLTEVKVDRGRYLMICDEPR